MKKILVILLIVFTFLGKNVKAQTSPIADTLAYLQSIVNNKYFFIGKPFSVLMDSLKIQIKYFNQNTDIIYDLGKETSTSFGFHFPQGNEDFYLTYPRIKITWQNYLNANQSWNLYQTYNGGWSPVVIAFYAKGIISDIQIRE